VNGWGKDLPDLAVQFIPPQKVKQPASPFQEPESAAAEKASVRTQKLTPEFVRTSDSLEGESQTYDPRFMQLERELTPADIAVIALSLATKELHYPLSELFVVPKTIVDPSRPWPTETQFLLRSALRVAVKEGESLLQWLKWFRTKFILIVSVGLLISIGTATFLKDQLHWLTVLFRETAVLIPTWLAVAFSAGLLAQRLASYGWRRLLRLLWVRVSRNRSLRDWYDADRFHLVSDKSKKQR